MFACLPFVQGCLLHCHATCLLVCLSACVIPACMSACLCASLPVCLWDKRDLPVLALHCNWNGPVPGAPFGLASTSMFTSLKVCPLLFACPLPLPRECR